MMGLLPGPEDVTTAAVTLRVLLVEDNNGAALLVREMLDEAAPRRFAIECAERLGDGVDRLLDGGYDCVLLDLSLPDATGLDGLAQVRTVAIDVPVIVLSGGTDEALAVLRERHVGRKRLAAKRRPLRRRDNHRPAPFHDGRRGIRGP